MTAKEILDGCDHVYREFGFSGPVDRQVCLRCAQRAVEVAEKSEREACAEAADVFMHIVTREEEDRCTPAAYSNSTVRRIVAAIRARGGQ